MPSKIQTTAICGSDCVRATTHGTDDPAVRICDMCGGIVPTDPATGNYLDAMPPVDPIGACSRCGVETDGRMICDRCRRAIFKQAQRLGTLTGEEIAAYANQP